MVAFAAHRQTARAALRAGKRLTFATRRHVVEASVTPVAQLATVGLGVLATGSGSGLVAHKWQGNEQTTDLSALPLTNVDDLETLYTKEDVKTVCKEAPKVARRKNSSSNVMCVERAEADSNVPVKVVVFDLDETLTIGTFMPKTQEPLSVQEAMKYSFDSPWTSDGQRLRRIKQMLAEVTKGADGQPRKLAVLTRNESGIQSVVQFLQNAGLDDHFSFIWAMDSATGQNSVVRNGKSWDTFKAPFRDVPDHKADVLYHMVEKPWMWFPQRNVERSQHDELRIENIVLVDDVPGNFESCFTGRKIARFCLVERFDASFRDLGLQNLGGIGAKSEDDYSALQQFIEAPWLCKGSSSNEDFRSYDANIAH